MIGFNRNLVNLLIISNAIYVISESSANNATSDPRIVNQQPNSLKLKNVNYAKYLSIENDSAIIRPEKHPDAEQIFLPLNGHNYHPEKVLERISTDPAIAVYDNEKPFDFLNFEPYIVKPLNVEYSQIYSHLQAKVQKKRNREAEELSKESQQSIVTLKKPGLHIDTSSYYGEPEWQHENGQDQENDDEDHLQNIDCSVNETVSTSAPTEPPAPTSISPQKPSREEFSDQIEKLDGAHAEKLVIRPSPNNFSLPIGFAFFDAWKSENSPYFSPLILERSKIVEKVSVPRKKTKQTKIGKATITTERAIIENSDRETENIAPKAEDYPFGEKILTNLPNLTQDIQHIDDYYDMHSEQPKPKKKKKSARNLKKKKSKKRKLKHKKKYYYNRNIYYPAESQRITTTIGMANSRFSDTIRKEVIPRSGVINHSGYKKVQAHTLPTSVLKQPQATQETAATDRKAEIAPARRPAKRPPPPPQELHYFQYVNVMGKGTYNAGVGKGNEDHFIVQHERADDEKGIFQKRVRWGDKKGGFGEHYYDLNHHKPLDGS